MSYKERVKPSYLVEGVGYLGAVVGGGGNIAFYVASEDIRFVAVSAAYISVGSLAAYCMRRLRRNIRQEMSRQDVAPSQLEVEVMQSEEGLK